MSEEERSGQVFPEEFRPAADEEERSQETPPQKPDPVRTSIDGNRLISVFALQLLLGATSLVVCQKIGATKWFLIPGWIVFAAFFAWFVRLTWNSNRNSVSFSSTSVLVRCMWLGVAITAAGFLLLGWAVWLRTSYMEWLSPLGWLIFLGSVSLAWFSFSTGRSTIRAGQTPWFQFAVGATFIPCFLAWVVASISVSWVKPYFVTTLITKDEKLGAEHSERDRWSSQEGWQDFQGRQLNVAVTLSGGGYRAAVFHAGVLRALDENCVPIRFLSTVSGGSIVGTYYALGHTPEHFKDKLVANRPGLADSLLSLWYFAAELWWPTWSNVDTFSEHLRAIYFQDKTLADVDDGPMLIINATDIEQPPPGMPVIFYRNRNAEMEPLDYSTELADLVAASGAFPGAFQPKSIDWPSSFREMRGLRRYVDGGVVDNLGYLGLQAFLNGNGLRRNHKPKPDLIIVSDASAPLFHTGLPPKVDLITLLTRSEEISYSIQLSLIRSRVHEGYTYKNEQIETQTIRSSDDSDGNNKIRNLASPFKNAAGKFMDGHEVAKEVVRLPTLDDLSPDQVEKTYWLGYVLAKNQWPTIEQWRQKHSGGQPCHRDMK